MKIHLKNDNTLPNHNASQKSFLRKQAMATLASSFMSLSSGVVFGLSAVMLPQLREDKTIFYNPAHESWIASITSLAMVIGSVSSGTISDIYGRKIAHIIVGIPFTVSWIIIACANSTTIIVVGRFISGLSVGAIRAVTSVYIGEITDPKFRAAALFLPGLIINIGVVSCHAFAYYLYWKISCLVSLIPALVFLLIFLFCNESPLWLIAKGKTDEGIATFRWFRGTDDASEAELKEVLDKQSVKPNISMKETLNAVCSKVFIVPMLVLMVVMTDGQFSGMNAVSFYGLDVLERIFSGKVDPFVMIMVMDCVRSITALSVCIAGTFVSKRAAFLICSFGYSLFVFGLVTCLKINCDNFMWVPISCFIISMCFSSAIVSLSWSLVPELLPSNARGFGSGLNGAFTFIMLFIIVKMLPGFTNMYGDWAMFTFYGISTFTCGTILTFVLPETNGKTLQSIEDSYSKKVVKQSVKESVL